jgi:heterotetrameric sarcosine oxidase gamma subunit
MPDRGLFWSPVPDWSRADIHHEGLGITALSAGAAWLVSGDLSRFLELRNLSCVGPRETCGQGTYALRLAPERLLFVSRDGEQSVRLQGGEAWGWSDDGVAITDVSDGFVLFDVVGPAAPNLMALGAAYDFAAKPAGPAESASMLFAGLRVAVARILPGWRLHIERPYATALWQWLQHAASEWAKPPAREGQSADSPLPAGKNGILP